MAGIRLEFAQFGDFDSFDIIRSTSSMASTADADLPSPVVTGLKTMYWVDTNIVDGGTYYYKVRALKNGIEKISSEIKVIADIADNDQYWANVTSLLRFNGANNSTAFTDERGHVWSRVGSPYISTDQSKFGGSSGRFAKSNYIQKSNNDGYLFSETEDFTIETWIFIPTNALFYDTEIPIICVGAQDISPSGGGWNFCLFDKTNATIRLERDNTNLTVQTAEFNINSAIPRDTWIHVEFGRSSGTTYGFFQGNLVGTTTVHNNIPFNSPNIQNVSIGSGNGRLLPNNWHLDAFLDDIRITKGICRHTSSFTPPDREAPNF